MTIFILYLILAFVTSIIAFILTEGKEIVLPVIFGIFSPIIWCSIISTIFLYLILWLISEIESFVYQTSRRNKNG